MNGIHVKIVGEIAVRAVIGLILNARLALAIVRES
jgi:hypothetical protein